MKRGASVQTEFECRKKSKILDLATLSYEDALVLYEGLSEIITSYRATIVEKVPEEVWASILRFCSVEDLLVCGMVCHSWQPLSTNLIVTQHVREMLAGDPVLRKFTALESLNLSHNSRTTDKGIRGLTNLTKLVANERITDFGLRKLTKLVHLDITSNDEITVSGLMLMKNLEHLELNGNISLEDLRAHTNLTRLRLDSITPASNLTYLTRLRILDLQSNLSVGERDLFRLPNLTALSLERNLRILVREVAPLTNITRLNLRGNCRMEGIVLRDFTHLRKLILDKVDVADDELITLTNLDELSIVDTQLTGSFLKHLTNLTSLNIASTNILGDILLPLKNLTSLNISENLDVGEELSKLTTLRSLSVCYADQINDDVIKCLTNLTYLNASCNYSITDEGIMHLVNLEQLDCWNSNISAISISQLPKLRKLRYSMHDTIQELPYEEHQKLECVPIESVFSEADSYVQCLFTDNFWPPMTEED